MFYFHYRISPHIFIFLFLVTINNSTWLFIERIDGNYANFYFLFIYLIQKSIHCCIFTLGLFRGPKACLYVKKLLTISRVFIKMFMSWQKMHWGIMRLQQCICMMYFMWSSVPTLTQFCSKFLSKNSILVISSAMNRKSTWFYKVMSFRELIFFSANFALVCDHN